MKKILRGLLAPMLCVFLLLSSAQALTLSFRDPVMGYLYGDVQGEPGERLILPLPADNNLFLFLYWVDEEKGRMYAGGMPYDLTKDTVLTAYWQTVEREEETPAEEQEGPEAPPPMRPLSLRESEETPVFRDVSRQDWFSHAVEVVCRYGLMSGVGERRFAPDATFSRAMAAQLLYNLEGKPEGDTQAGFNDVKAEDWYAKAVNWCAEEGILSGTGEGRFDPLGQVTRQDLATALYHYAQYRGYGFYGDWYFSLDYPDAEEVASYADEAMHWMVMSGVMNGMEGRLNPQGLATRAQAASILQHFVQVLSQ